MTSLLLNLSVLAIFMHVIMRFARKWQLGKIALPALLLKVIAGLLLGLVFKFIYGGGDTFSYYSEGLRLASYIRIHPGSFFHVLNQTEQLRDLWPELTFTGQPRALFFSKIVAVIYLFTHANYWLMSIYFSLLNFLAALILVRQLVHQFKGIKTAAIVAFLFFPSVVFWSSGILKESVAISALYFIVAFMLREEHPRNVKEWLWVVGFLLAVYLLWKLRYFYLGVCLPLSVAAFAGRQSQRYIRRQRIGKAFPWILYGATAMVLFIFISRMHYNLRHEHFINVVYENYRLFIARSAPGTAVIFKNLRPEWSSFLIHAPKALFSGLFSPNLWQVHNLKQWPQAIENFFLLVISLISLFSLIKKRPPLHFWGLSALIYIVLMSVLLVYASPNYGSLMRYRAGYLSFFVLLVLYMIPVSSKAIRGFFSGSGD